MHDDGLGYKLSNHSFDLIERKTTSRAKQSEAKFLIAPIQEWGEFFSFPLFNYFFFLFFLDRVIANDDNNNNNSDDKTSSAEIRKRSNKIKIVRNKRPRDLFRIQQATLERNKSTFEGRDRRG